MNNAGSLIWAFVSGPDALAAVEPAIAEGRVAGVWLLASDMPDPVATAKLIDRLQAAAPWPLLIGVDAEAGMGHVMGGGTVLPTAMAIGATGDPNLARAAGEVTAAEAAAVGVNVVAAPVLDVNVNPDNPIINTRAFGETPEVVTEMGLAFVEGVDSVSQPGRVLPIGKHFPGHGDTSWDSHLELGVVDQPRSRLDAVELAPFRAAIDAGIPLLMTAHIAYPALDPSGSPATLSRPILTDLLRGELGFKGAVVTDAMNMHAISKNYDIRESAVSAVAAGCDLVMTERWDDAHAALEAAVENGTLSRQRVEEAAKRVDELRDRLFQNGAGSESPESGLATSVGSPVHHDVADRIASASVRVVQGETPRLGSAPFIVATDIRNRYGPGVEERLREALARVGPIPVDFEVVDEDVAAEDVPSLLARARAAGWLVILHFNKVSSYEPAAVSGRRGLGSLASRSMQGGTPTLVASLGSPYVLRDFQGVSAQICSYSTSDASIAATLALILGSATKSSPAAATP